MTIQPVLIPPEWNWAFDIVVGQNWPQADEDALRRVAQAWTDALQGLLNIADGGNTAARNVNYSVQAVSSDEFSNYWSQYVNGDDSVIGQLAQMCEQLAAFALSFSEQTEFTKLSINIQIIILIIQLIIDAVLAFVTFGTSTAEGIAATFFTRSIVEGFLFHFLEGVLAAVLPDVITQWELIREGHRSSFDIGEAFQALQMGVTGGLIGAGVGGLGGSGLLGKLGGRLLGDAGEAGGEFAGRLLTNPMVHGAVTNVTTNYATGLIDSGEDQLHAALDPSYAKQLQQQTQDQGYADEKAGQNPLIAMLNGAFTGGVFHSVHEGATALAGYPEPEPLTLDNQQQFAAVQVQDGTGSRYVLFDQKMHLVGTGTTDGNDNIAIAFNDGSSYTAGIAQLGDYRPAPVTAGTVPVTGDIHDTPVQPETEVQQLGPATTDPVTSSADQPAGQPATSHSEGPPEQHPEAALGLQNPRPAAAQPLTSWAPSDRSDPLAVTTTAQAAQGRATEASTQALAAPEAQPSASAGQQPPASPATPVSASGSPQQTYQSVTPAERPGQLPADQGSESVIPGPVLYPISTPEAAAGGSGFIQQALAGDGEPGNTGAASLPHLDATPGTSGYEAYEHRSPGRLPATRPRDPLPGIPADATLVNSRRGSIYRLADDGTGISKYGKMIDGQFHVIVEGDLPAGREKAVYALFDRATGEFLKFGQLSGSDALTRYTGENLTPGRSGEQDFRLPARGEGKYPNGYDRYDGDPPLSGRKVVLKIIASHLGRPEADAIEKHGLNDMWGGPANVEREYLDNSLYHRQEMQNQAAAARNSFFDWVQRKIGTDPRWSSIDRDALRAAFPDPDHEPVLPGQPGGRPPYPPNVEPVFHSDGTPRIDPSRHTSPQIGGFTSDNASPYHVIAEEDLAGPKPTTEELRAHLMRMLHAAADGTSELAIAYEPGTDEQSGGHLIIIEGTRDSVGLPPERQGYRIIAHTQQGEGPSEADRTAATGAGHPLEMIVYHDGSRTRAELFDPKERDPAKGIYDYNGEPKPNGSEIAGRTQRRPISALLDKLVGALPDSAPGPSAGAQQHHSPAPEGEELDSSQHQPVQPRQPTRAELQFIQNAGGIADSADSAIFPHLREAANAAGGTLRGIEYYVKDGSSLLEKILKLGGLDSLAQRPDELGKQLNDVLRYTIMVGADSYTGGVVRALAHLQASGYRLVAGFEPDGSVRVTDLIGADGLPVQAWGLKNFWKESNRYVGINMTLLSPDNMVFEQQFHTPESLVVKQLLTHEMYKVFSAEGPPAVGKLNALMEIVAVTARDVPMPAGTGIFGPPKDSSVDWYFAKQQDADPRAFAEFVRDVGIGDQGAEISVSRREEPAVGITDLPVQPTGQPGAGHSAADAPSSQRPNRILEALNGGDGGSGTGSDRFRTSTESDLVRVLTADPPPTDPVDVTRAFVVRGVRELRQVFGKQAIFQRGDVLTIVTSDNDLHVVSRDRIRVLIDTEPAETGSPAAFPSATAGDQPTVVVPVGSSPEEVSRLLARSVGDFYASQHPEGRAAGGAFRELDVLSMQWNRAASFARYAQADGDVIAARVWENEAARLRQEFRTGAEELGIVPTDGPGSDLVRAASETRKTLWPGLSDNTRRLSTELAGDTMPAFLPGTGYFRSEFNRLDSLVYYLRNVAGEPDRAAFLAEFGQRLQTTDLPDDFKAVYKQYMPSRSTEGQIPADSGFGAWSAVTELGRDAYRLYSDIADWTQRSGVLALGDMPTVDDAVAAGEAQLYRDHEIVRQHVDRIVADFAEQHKIELGYVGSLRNGFKGPHKGNVHVNLGDFDLDLFIVNRDEYDLTYPRVASTLPQLLSRGKILPDPRATPELYLLSEQIAGILRTEFPDNASLAESSIVLRREPPRLR